MSAQNLNLISRKNRVLLPIFVSIVCFVMVGFVWEALDSQRERSLRELIKSEAEFRATLIDVDIRSRLLALQRVVTRWEVRGGTPKEEFLADAKALIDHLPGFQALEWVDNRFYVRWVEPLKGNEQAQNLNLAFEAKRRLALNAARENRIPTMTNPIDLVQGGKGFLIYIPIYIENQFEGFLLAVFRISPWLDFVFKLQKDHVKFRAAVSIDNEYLYKKEYAPESRFADWKAASSVHMKGHNVRVEVVPTQGFFIANRSRIPEWSAAIGLLLTALVAYMVHILLLLKTELAERQRVERALHRAKNQAEEAEERAEAANRVKSVFLTSMSHELMTPLNAIIGFGGVLAQSFNAQLSEEQEKLTRHILDGSQKLHNMFKNIMLFSEISSGDAHIVPGNVIVKEMAEECIKATKADANKHGIKLILDVTDDDFPTIRIDQERGKEILMTFLSNAVLYNKAGGEARVSVSLEKEGWLRFSVSDTGQGIPTERQGEVFQPFKRLGMENTAINGTGVGLTIAKALSELMDGRVGFKNNEEKGCTFWVEFPSIHKA